MNIRVASYKHLKDKSKICSLLGFCIVWFWRELIRTRITVAVKKAPDINYKDNSRKAHNSGISLSY